MKEIIKLKAALCDTYSQKIAAAKSLLVFEYQGLTALELSDLRRKLHVAGADLYVLKNNIINRALTSAKITGFSDLAGPNALALASHDEIVIFKEIYEISKIKPFIKFKGGVIDNTYVEANKIPTLAQIPSRENLYAMFLSCLQAPVRNFLYGLKAISETK